MQYLITELYERPRRWYHTYEHAFNVAHDAQFLARLIGLDEDAQHRCYIAGIWHDAVYVWGNKDNEAQSADAFLRRHPLKTDVADLIRRTTVEDHLSEEATVENDPELACLLDADLKGLSADYNTFCSHQLDIAKEAGLTCVTKEHARFLLQFLHKKNIYRTLYMQTYESNARTNILKLAEQLGLEELEV